MARHGVVSMMRLNFGCGEFYQEGWTNIELVNDGTYRADLYADVRDVPLPDACAEAIYCGHVLEHIALEDAPRVLAEAWRLLIPGGRLCVVGPDLDRADPADKGLVDMVVVGGRPGVDGHDYPSTMHHWTCTEAKLLLIVQAVFPDAHPMPSVGLLVCGWPAVAEVDWQCAVEATK
jgi:predicted SAM-dependent methyltransferase